MQFKDDVERVGPSVAHARGSSGLRGSIRAALVIAVAAGVLYAMGRMSDRTLLIFAAKIILVGDVTASLLYGAAVWLLGAARARTAMVNLTLAVVSLSIAAVAGEFAARFAFGDITTTGDDSSYFARRWTASHVRLNSLGFREREFDPVKPVGVYRIAIVGDSFAFGQGIEESERFGNRIAEALIGSGAHVELLNFGRAGADTGDEIEILRRAVLPLRPDYVILQWFVNDFEMSQHADRSNALPLVPSSTLEPWLHRNSALYYIVNGRWATLQAFLGRPSSYSDYMRARFADPSSRDSRAEIAALSEFLDVCRANQTPVSIVLFPDLSEIESYAFGYLHDRVLEFCGAEAADCLDLRGPLAQAAITSRLFLNRFDGHPNALANRIAADSILARFRGAWLAGASKTSSSPKEGARPALSPIGR
jgi:GDSL-like lipase/acylhydrolase family protein